MKVPQFSIVTIAKNESKTLPRMVKSASEFQARGGEIIVVDTGSTDGTPQVARDLGCTVFEKGATFQQRIDEETAREINGKFVADGEKAIVKNGDRLFDFATARNYAVSKATHDWVIVIDCDECFTQADLDKLAEVMVTPKIGRLEHEFVYAHDQFSQPVIQFRMSRFYDRRKFHWNPKCIVHEVLTTLEGAVNTDTLYLGPGVLKVEHWQNPQTNRSGYLIGLALDCFLHPDNDRNSHYFGRELFYRGLYKSSIREFHRHIAMNGWPVERAQSMIYIGDCYKAMSRDDEAVVWWNKAFLADGTRREPLMRLAHYFFSKDDKHKVAAYASAALALPRVGCYMDNENHYRQEPHELLYWALWYLGDRDGSADHWRKAAAYQPLNPKYLHDGQFYIKTGLHLDALKEAVKARQPFSFVKLGDGERACISGAAGQNCDGQPYTPQLAQALLKAYEFMAGKVHVVDFSNQSIFNMLLHRTDRNLAEIRDFWLTVGGQTGVKVFVGPQRLKPVADLLKARFIEVPLVDAFSDLERIKKQCFDHCKRDAIFVFSAGMTSKILVSQMLQLRQDITCIDAGSAFDPLFVGETRTFQAPKAVLEKLYFGDEKGEPLVSICIPTLGRPEKLKRLLELIPKTAEYGNFEVLVEHDSFETRVGVPRLLRRMVEKARGEFIVFLGNDCQPKPGWLRLAMEGMRKNFPQMDGLVGFNDGITDGKENPHWLASKKLLPMLDGAYFFEGYSHCGCDNELTARCRIAGRYYWAKEAEVYHEHFSRTGDFDDTYRLAWREDLVAMDRALLESRAEKLGFVV